MLWLANGQAWVREAGLRNSFTIGQRVQVLARSGPLPGFIAGATGHLASLALRGADRVDLERLLGGDWPQPG